LTLDFRQPEARKYPDPVPELPVLYITQLLGLALGLPTNALGLDALTISAAPLTAKRAAAGQNHGRQ
jgi:heterodisulfide reductase subunit B